MCVHITSNKRLEIQRVNLIETKGKINKPTIMVWDSIPLSRIDRTSSKEVGVQKADQHY